MLEPINNQLFVKIQIDFMMTTIIHFRTAYEGSKMDVGTETEIYKMDTYIKKSY